MYWIIRSDSILQIETDKDYYFLNYIIYAGNLEGCKGCISKQWIDWAIESNTVKVTTNPLEAYALKILLKQTKIDT
jgi:hypothetical protein